VTATDLNLITAQGTFSVFVTTSPAPSNARMANLTVTTPLSDMLVVDIFPNPAHEFINVTIENPAGEQLQVEVLGYDGKILSRRQIDQVMLDFAIDMKSFGPGLYILHVIGANGSISKKFVME
jgi:hypothetical protein